MPTHLTPEPCCKMWVFNPGFSWESSKCTEEREAPRNPLLILPSQGSISLSLPSNHTWPSLHMHRNSDYSFLTSSFNSLCLILPQLAPSHFSISLQEPLFFLFFFNSAHLLTSSLPNRDRQMRRNTLSHRGWRREKFIHTIIVTFSLSKSKEFLVFL